MTDIMEKHYEVVQAKPWQPNKPISRGAIAYHQAVANATYYLENLDELIKIVAPRISENNIIVDFGAGTGASALRLLVKLKVHCKLWLVDNSAAWLGKAYDIFKDNPNVECFLLEKIQDGYATLAETIGEESVDHVMSANTIHLVPNLEETFKGIYAALKTKGTFTFQSGNIIRSDRKKGILMADDTFKRVHDLALELVRIDDNFAKYRKELDKRIEIESNQRKFVFPEPKPIEDYLMELRTAGFEYEKPYYKFIKIKYKDWLDFLRVKRLQAGILPEVGGKDPSPEEEHDRDKLIKIASAKLFKELETQNPFADDKCFIVEWIYVCATKNG